jgi:hypothetical protein
MVGMTPVASAVHRRRSVQRDSASPGRRLWPHSGSTADWKGSCPSPKLVRLELLVAE